MFQSILFKNERISTLSNELIDLWNINLNFPVLKRKSVFNKVGKLIDMYQSHQKRCQMTLDEVFDITDNNGIWLNKEDKMLYSSQLNSHGKVGYSSLRLAPVSSVHPSKRLKVTCSSIDANDEIKSVEDSTSEESLETLTSYDFCSRNYSRKQKMDTKIGAQLSSQTMISSRKTSKILSIMKEEGFDVPNATHSAINKRILKNSVEMKDILKDKIQNSQDYCLHFDGKRITKSKKERVVVCLSNATDNLYLGVLTMENCSAESISDALIELIDNYNAWVKIKMIISDATNVNTGKRNGIVVRLQRAFILKGLPAPQYVACQLHVLDRILRLIMDEAFLISQTSPNIEYFFVKDIDRDYENLKRQYKYESETSFIIKNKWNNDMDYFQELCLAFQHYAKVNLLPKIKFRTLPNLSQARWNSRGIYCLLAFFLVEEHRSILKPVCNFIVGNWGDLWFSNHKYNENAFSLIQADLKYYGSMKALKCLETHFSKEESRIAISRTNRLAERAIRQMADIENFCKSDKSLNDKFVLFNVL